MKKSISLLIILFTLCITVWADTGTEFIRAAKDGDLNKVQQLLKAGTDINTKDGNGATALTWAAKYGHLEVVRLLLQNGIELDTRSKKNCYMPLIQAIGNKHTEVAELLIAAGMDVNAVTTADSNLKGVNLGWKKGQTALSMAREGQAQEEMTQLLIGAGAHK